ncbi:MAG: hypothetical protein P4L75_03760 [Clostridia bacterium]|nr:hypothetical protein [Clostridia bacterium]MDR3645541.1 hypothetical protein [Clostridia bacterium]
MQIEQGSFSNSFADIGNATKFSGGEYQSFEPECMFKTRYQRHIVRLQVVFPSQASVAAAYRRSYIVRVVQSLQRLLMRSSNGSASGHPVKYTIAVVQTALPVRYSLFSRPEVCFKQRQLPN